MNRRGLLSGIKDAAFAQPTESRLEATRVFNANTTLADLVASTGAPVGLRLFIEANKCYRFRAHLFITMGSTGLCKVAINHAVASPTVFYAAIKYVDFTTPGVTGSRQTTLGSAVAFAVAVTGVECEIEGVIQPVGDGVLAVQGAQSVSNGTDTQFLVGSYFHCVEVPRSIINT